MKIKSVSYLFEEAQRTLMRFLGSLLSAFAATVFFVHMISEKVDPTKERLGFTLLLGLPLFLAMTLYRESRGWTKPKHRVIELVVGAALLAGHYLVTRDLSNSIYFLKYLQISLATHLLVAVSTSLHKPSENGFWQLNRNIFLRILFSFIYAAVFYIGLVIALITVKALFKLDISDKTFGYLWVFSAITLQTWHFLAGLPENLSALKTDKTYPKGLRIFVQYLLIPLVSLYMIILYTYMGKIVFTGNWPQGYVGWLVSIMSVLGILNLLLIDPEKENSETSWIRTYAKAYYILIIPLLLMLFSAIGRRISEYGITEQRYFLAVLGVLLLVLCLYFIFSKKKSIRMVPLSLLAVAIVTLWGPWSAYSVSLQSQLQRARELMTKNQLLINEKAQRATGLVPSDDQTEIASALQYIVSVHGTKPLEKWFPDEILREVQGSYGYARARYGKPDAILKHLNLVNADLQQVSSDTGRHFYLKAVPENHAVAIGEYAHAYVFNELDREIRVGKRNLTLSLSENKTQIDLLENEKAIIRLPVPQMLDSMKDKLFGENPPIENLMIEAANEKIKVRVYFMKLDGSVQDGKYTFHQMRGYILFR